MYITVYTPLRNVYDDVNHFHHDCLPRAVVNSLRTISQPATLPSLSLSRLRRRRNKPKIQKFSASKQAHCCYIVPAAKKKKISTRRMHHRPVAIDLGWQFLGEKKTTAKRSNNSRDRYTGCRCVTCVCTYMSSAVYNSTGR